MPTRSGGAGARDKQQPESRGTYQTKGREQDQRHAGHMYGNVDRVMVVCPVLVHPSRLTLAWERHVCGESKATYEDELFFQVERHGWVRSLVTVRMAVFGGLCCGRVGLRSS